MRMDEQVRIKKEMLSSLVRQFCEQHLNEEYSHLCEKAIVKLSRKRQVPFMSGNVEVWAAAVVWCIARVRQRRIRQERSHVSSYGENLQPFRCKREQYWTESHLHREDAEDRSIRCRVLHTKTCRAKPASRPGGVERIHCF